MELFSLLRFFFYVFIITIPKFLTLFSVMKFPCNEDISVFQQFPCTECVCLTQNQTSSRKPPHTLQNSVKYVLVLWGKQTKRNETALGTARTRRYPNHNVETEVSNRIYREVTGRVVDTTWSGVDAGITKGSLRRGNAGAAEERGVRNVAGGTYTYFCQALLV